MPLQLDHLILPVNDREASIAFYTRIFGFSHEGQRDPFSAIRVTPDLILQLAPWGTKGGEHLAFSMSRAEFDEVFGRIRDAGIAYGDTFQTVGNMRGPQTNPVPEGQARPSISSIRAGTSSKSGTTRQLDSDAG